MVDVATYGRGVRSLEVRHDPSSFVMAEEGFAAAVGLLEGAKAQTVVAIGCERIRNVLEIHRAAKGVVDELIAIVTGHLT